jgi:hypothetical protein
LSIACWCVAEPGRIVEAIVIDLPPGGRTSANIHVQRDAERIHDAFRRLGVNQVLMKRILVTGWLRLSRRPPWWRGPRAAGSHRRDCGSAAGRRPCARRQ